MNKIRLVFFVALLVLNFNLLLAIKVPGFIVTNSSDTIAGEVQIPIFDSYTGGLSLFGINLEQFHSILRFRESGNGRFQSFIPNEIAGFGFEYKTIHYKFRAFSIETYSIIESERKRHRFLMLLYQGEVAVYKDIVRMANFIAENGLADRFIDHYDYYLFNEKQGLKRAIRTAHYKTVSDLLRLYEIEQDFIDLLPSDVRFKDLVEILQGYERWKD
ncbi:MAG: hypothetical protein LC643_09760 [Bacteroidales bacterium]|nr:hypothetical protein [Bacteroidales bacterium]